PGDLLDADDPGEAPSLTEPLNTPLPTPEAPTVEHPAEETPGVETHEIAQAGHEQPPPAPSGGILDTLGSLASGAISGLLSGITGLVSGTATGAAGQVGSAAGEKVSETQGAASEAVSSTAAETGAATREAGAAAETERGGLLGTIMGVLGSIGSVPSQAAGAVAGLMPSILGGAGLLTTLLGPFAQIFQRVLSGVPTSLDDAFRRLSDRINGIFARLDALVARITARIAAMMARITALAAAVANMVNTAVGGLARTVSDRIAQLPGAVRSVAQALIGGLLAMVQRVVAKITAAAQALVTKVIAGLTRILRGIESVVRRAIDVVRRTAQSILSGIQRIVNFVKSIVNRVIDWLIAKAKALLARALKAVLGPVLDRALKRVLDLIGPAVQGAVAQAKLMFPNGMPPPPQIAAAATQAAQQVPTAGPSMLDKLMAPEGDHIGIGYQAGTSAAEGVGGQIVGGGMLDIVFDYRRNDIGFFVSPGVGVQVNALDAGLSAGGGVAGSWGTVASFGKREDDVIQSYGGWFTNANYGMQGKLAYGAGAQLQTGGQFYSGGSHDFSSKGFTYTPFGAGTRQVPGTPGTTTTVPGQPGEHGTVQLGDIHYPTQGDDPGPHQAEIDAAAVRAHQIADQGPPGTQVSTIEALGHTSRGWRSLPPGQTREEANRALSERRGTNVADRLRPQVTPFSVSGHGAGDSIAASQGKAETDLSPEDQHTTITAATFRPPTGDTTTTTGGTPPTEENNDFTIKPSVPLPGAITGERTAWGWDTTVSGSGLAGAEGAAGVYGGFGISYSIPIGKTHVQPDTMQAIRSAVGVFKMIADVITISPLGFIRDAFGYFTPVADTAAGEVGGAATNFSMPTPS
ncbi:MAG TPA: hypothetical protein VFN44_11795, partial [Solirubrobacteraceae bacterium]|nr:hypothetical protein [Solirubrobacteraceae bacterium]